MNLRNVTSYDIGLDIGTGSVGWSVIDENGDLCRFKGRPTWGSRLFPGAETAAVARAHRGQRRRYDRRRQRLDLLQSIFAEEMAKIDDEFFVRLNQSRLLKEDRNPAHRDYRWPLFNGEGLMEPDYYQRFPTIYHLRAFLIDSDEPADLRLIYLAFHNIVKHRGNFLHQDSPSLSARNSDMNDVVERLASCFDEWCELQGIEAVFDSGAVSSALSDVSTSSAEKIDALKAAIRAEKDYRKFADNVSKALVGRKADFSQVFFVEAQDASFKLSEDEKVEAFSCPDEGAPLFEALRAVHSAYVLQRILGNAEGKTLSFCKVRDYDAYRHDLSTLKALVRDYAPERYDEFFRGARYEGSHDYDSSSAKGYTLYNLGTSKLSYEDFGKETLKLFKGTAAPDDPRYARMEKGFSDETFLRRLKTSDNGAIPYQLHLEEMNAIIDAQLRFHPFLAQEREKLNSLVSFRIPYYVGPLTQKNAAKAADGSLRFAWSERFEGKEGERVYPWNWDEIIDRDKSAEAFIQRMTGTCTYLRGEPVLPRCSLLYEMFCVLNELNGARWTQDGDASYRFDYADRAGIVEDLFKCKKTVAYKTVSAWLEEKHGPHGRRSSGGAYRVSGGQGESGFESKLNSYNDFRKILGVESIADDDIPMIEEIILWNTVFEDRSILKRKIKQKYGDRLTSEQIAAICRRRYTGWGRLSRKLLDGIKVHTDNGQKTIMDLLIEGNQTDGKRIGAAMNLMEILKDDDLGFEKVIDEANGTVEAGSFESELAELPGSPALRRGINQAYRIVKEIVSIAGTQPRRIFIEVTRDEDPRKKGQRTMRRYRHIEEALSSLKSEYVSVYKELKETRPQALDDKKLALYFMQCGKSMYSGEPLDIDRLPEYQIDHILPQSYIKDDSFENLALVRAEENQRKLNSLLLADSVIGKMTGFWKALYHAGLIGEKKLKNLMRRDAPSDDQMKGFVNRQLVETSQIVKHVQRLLQEHFPDARVLPVKAGISHQLREACCLPKCREANDFHHAHDAYLAAQIGRFILYRHAVAYDNPLKLAHVVRAFIKTEADAFRKTRKMPGTAGFVVSSFLSSGFDAETGEIFRDAWDADFEIDRIKRSLNYRDCFISRMPEETRGAFWDATIYSPRDTKKKLSLPLKRGLDPHRYGSYSREQFAYFFVYEAKSLRGKTAIEFAPVPVRVAAEASASKVALERYAERLAESKDLSFVRILKRKIYKYQQIEFNGDRLYITGLKEVRNARQFAFSLDETELLSRMVAGEACSKKEMRELLDRAVARFERYAKKLGTQLKVGSIAESFDALDVESQCAVVRSLISIASARVNMIDLSSLGEGKSVGCMKLTFSKELSDPGSDFWFVDVSVTGMFERRYRIGL